MFRQVFNPDNLLWRIIASFVDFVGLSLFWAVLCLPIVTIGPATAALYYTTVKVFRQRADDGFTLMWKSFRENLKKGIPATLICLPVIILCCYGYTVMLANSASDLGAVMFVAYYIALVIPIGTILWLFPMMGRFDLDLKTLFRNSFILAIRHLPFTVVLVLLDVQLIIYTIQTWAVLFIAPVGGALVGSIFYEQAFMKYLNVEEKAALTNMTVEEVQEQEEKQKKGKKKQNSGESGSKKNESEE